MQFPDQLAIELRARSDIADIWNYTRLTWGEAQADRYVDELFDSCKQLTEHPGLGRPQPHLHPDMHVYPHASHHIFYLANRRPVTFIAFLHGRMDMPQHLAGRL